MRASILALCLFALGCSSPPPAADLPAVPADDLPRSAEDLRGGGGDGAAPADLQYPADGCDTEHLCSRGLCFAPGESHGCGICRNPDPGEICSSDGDCQRMGQKDICVSSAQACTCGGQMVCRPGCTSDGECGEGRVCGAGYRCLGKGCAGDGDCPAAFACSAQKRCERRSCTGSDRCAGYCVKGLCYSTPGQCGFPAA